MTITVLVDFDNDSIATALAVADALGDDLWGVRLDTSETLVDRGLWDEMGDFAPTGVAPRLVEKVRDALDAAGHGTCGSSSPAASTPSASGSSRTLGVPVDAYGVGSSLIRGQNDFTADVVEVDGRPVAKVGRRARALRAPRARRVSGRGERIHCAAACSRRSITSAWPSATWTTGSRSTARRSASSCPTARWSRSRASRRRCSTWARATSSCSRRWATTRRSASSSPSAAPACTTSPTASTDINRTLGELNREGVRMIDEVARARDPRLAGGLRPPLGDGRSAHRDRAAGRGSALMARPAPTPGGDRLMAGLERATIGFEGGQVLACESSPRRCDRLTAALAAGGWHDLEVDDGTVRLDLARSSTCAPSATSTASASEPPLSAPDDEGRDRRAAQRGQVVAVQRAHTRRRAGGQLPVHDDRPERRDRAGGGRAPGRRGPDRRGLRGRLRHDRRARHRRAGARRARGRGAGQPLPGQHPRGRRDPPRRPRPRRRRRRASRGRRRSAARRRDDRDRAPLRRPRAGRAAARPGRAPGAVRRQARAGRGGVAARGHRRAAVRAHGRLCAGARRPLPTRSRCSSR